MGETYIYIIIVAVVALLVAGIIIVMTRSLARKTSSARGAASPHRGEMVGRMRADRATSEADPFPPSSPGLGKEIETRLEEQSEEVPPASDRPGHQNDKPDSTLPEAERSSGTEEEEEMMEDSERRQEPPHKDDSLNAFRVEMMEDTGLARLAQSLEDVDISNLVRVVKDVSKEIDISGK